MFQAQTDSIMWKNCVKTTLYVKSSCFSRFLSTMNLIDKGLFFPALYKLVKGNKQLMDGIYIS